MTRSEALRLEMNEWFALATDCLSDHRRGLFTKYINEGVRVWRSLQEELTK